MTGRPRMFPTDDAAAAALDRVMVWKEGVQVTDSFASDPVLRNGGKKKKTFEMINPITGEALKNDEGEVSNWKFKPDNIEEEVRKARNKLSSKKYAKTPDQEQPASDSDDADVIILNEEESDNSKYYNLNIFQKEKETQHYVPPQVRKKMDVASNETYVSPQARKKMDVVSNETPTPLNDFKTDLISQFDQQNPKFYDFKKKESLPTEKLWPPKVIQKPVTVPKEPVKSMSRRNPMYRFQAKTSSSLTKPSNAKTAASSNGNPSFSAVTNGSVVRSPLTDGNISSLSSRYSSTSEDWQPVTDYRGYCTRTNEPVFTDEDFPPLV